MPKRLTPEISLPSDAPGPRAQSGVTLKAVAEAAGVSVSLVSKVLHGGATSIRVGEERAAKIREVATRLRYQPNVVARQLRSSKTRTIGLVWDHMQRIADGPLYYALLLDGVAEVLFQNHYSFLILAEFSNSQLSWSIRDCRVDGLIWCKMPHDEAVFDEIQFSKIKVVGLNSPPPLESHDVPFVACDNEAGVGLMIDHLCNLGHQKILFVLDAGWQTAPDAVVRLAAFRNAMKERGLSVGPEDVAEWHDTRADMQRWWTSGHKHTAIFAWHEGLAGKLLLAATSLGITVPSDVSVAGFDSTRYCETTQPRLTAVRQPVREMAQFAAQTLLRVIAEPDIVPASQTFPCSLDVRESTGLPRSR